MAEVELATGINPDDPEELVLAVVIDPGGSPGERALVALTDLGVTDVYAHGRIENGEVTVDIVANPATLARVDVTDVFPAHDGTPHDRTAHDGIAHDGIAHDGAAVRLLRVTGETTHTTLPERTFVFTTPLEELTDNEDELPFVLVNR